jgi:ferredoxin-type protein NapH
MKFTIQWIRHTVQFIVLLTIIAAATLGWYRIKVSHGEIDRILSKNPNNLQGQVLSGLDRWLRPPSESGAILQSPADRDQAVQEQLKNIQGNTWAANIFGLPIIDPLGGAESLLSGKALLSILLLGLSLPVLITLLFGRIFCSWICPAGFLFELADRLRTLLSRLGLKLPNARLWRGQKYVLLIVGLALSCWLAIPLLSYLYPPAILTREIHGGVFGYFDRVGEETFKLEFVFLSGSLLFVLGIVLSEVFMSKRLWCRTLCPGGGLYSLLGALRLVRVKRDAPTCTLCSDCVVACPMGLNPMQDKMGVECDNCLACVSSCSEKALSLTIGRSGKNRPMNDPHLYEPKNA